MNLIEILNQAEQQPALLLLGTIAIGVLLLLVLLLLILNRKRIVVGYREWRIQRSLNQVGCEQIRALVCPDGLDGYYLIDRLALVRDAILLISYKPYSGNIYCADKISDWTQMVGQKSFKFENPLFELENQITSLRLVIGSVPLNGYLFFNHSAEFPKGHPSSVLHPQNIPQQFLARNCTPVKAEVRAAWEILRQWKSESVSGSQLHAKT